MKPVLEETIEYITGKSPKAKPQPTTTGLKEALDPGKLMADSLRQVLGYGAEKKVPTKGEVQQMASKDQEQTNPEISKLQEVIVQETLNQPGTPQPVVQKPGQQKGNVAVINPSQKPRQPETPAYVSGKPGYDPEREALEEKRKKEQLPELPVMSSKRRRGSWTQAFERKGKAEIKGGRE